MGVTNVDFIEGEIWRDVIGFEGLYSISSLGRVSSLKRKKGEKRLMKIHSSKGYSIIGLRLGKKHQNKSIHRLVAITFIPNPENKPQVNHKNGIKADNRLVNLEWCTKSENQKHSFYNGLQKPIIGESHYKSILKKSDVIQILVNKDNLTYKQMANKYKVCWGTISAIRQRKMWKHIVVPKYVKSVLGFKRPGKRGKYNKAKNSDIT